MFSTRNANMEEPYNSEGLTNHHRGDGTNYISLTGTEYFNLAPVNDWQKIPGATILQKESLPDENQIQKYGVMDFVGAVTDGMYGAVAFDFISPHDPLRARKAWFFFDNEYVCLGAGIRSQSNRPVVTTVNQSLKQGEVTYSANKTSWIHHDRIGYIFPDSAKVHFTAGPATGSWYTSNRQTNIPKENVTMDVFKLWIDHGARVNGGTYQYIVMPAASKEQVTAAQQKPAVTILSNTPEIQAVWHNTLNILQVVCYKNGTVQLSGGYRLTMDTPGILMAKTGSGGAEVSVADPSRKLGKILFSVNYRVEKKGQNFTAVWNEAKGVSEIFVDLPQDGYAGQSVTVKL
jgi:chondroitin AC lyase